MKFFFFFLTPKAKINKWYYLKLKSFCVAKESITKIRRQPTEWEKIFGNNVSDKGLIFKLYKNSYNSIAKITQIIWFKNGQRLNRNSSKDIQLAKGYMKKGSISLVMKEMQIKATVRYYFTPVRMAVLKTRNNECEWGYGETGALLHCWWECRLVQPL